MMKRYFFVVQYDTVVDTTPQLVWVDARTKDEAYKKVHAKWPGIHSAKFYKIEKELP